ncbi:MAG TPA: PAS domain S-box protein [Azospira sp.]|nr:PAS domain S-box protein [Azospira sp.]HNN07477.1 PAS domain S-box protein [Azospira sp.]
MSMIRRLSQSFDALGLRAKVVAVLLVATTAIGGAVTLVSYVHSRHLLVSHTEEMLAVKAHNEQREIELRFGNAFALASSLAANTMTANALADSFGRENYLFPLLRNQALGIPGAELLVADYQGRTAASSRPTGGDVAATPEFLAMIEDGRSRSMLDRMRNEGPAIVVMLPVRYRLTGNVEGGVVLRVPLAGLLGSGDWADARYLVDGRGALRAGKLPAENAIDLQAKLNLPPPVDDLGLALGLARDRAAVFSNLNLLLALYVVIGVVVLAGVALIARIGTRYITRPLSEVASAAEAIAATGRPVGQLPARGDDEFGRLSAAFNTMVARLSESYGELEDLVVERTRDYEESQQEAERASKLLREAVQSIAVGFTIYDEDDRLVLCNEAYLSFYEQSRGLIVPGARFEDIVRKGAERGQYTEAIGNVDAWVANRVAAHQAASGQTIEQRLGDGRWLLIIEHRTPSGYIVGNRIDITELKNTAENLRLRELYQRATLDNLPFFFWLKDSAGRFLAVNKVFSDACGQPGPESVVGLTDRDVWPAELAEKYVADDLAVIAGRREVTVEEPVAGGAATGWIETYKKPVIGDGGNVIGTVGFARDISERKHMEQALQESELRFELAVRGANDGIWDWNTTTGEAFFSEQWKSMLGYTSDEIGNDISEWQRLVHPDDLERVLVEMQRHLTGKTPLYAAELRLRCRDGGYKWILCRGKAMFDATGNPVRMSGSHTDITERRESEARIRDRNEQLDAIFSLSPDGFVSFDASHCVRFATPAFHRMTGIDQATITGIDEAAFSALLAEACVPHARFPGVAQLRASFVAQTGGGEAPGHHRRQLIELAGPGKRILEVGICVAQGESVSQILYFRDVTYETEVDQMKSEFLSTAAHELRTPMASIYGFSELMLAQKFSPDEQADFLGAIYRQSELMISIINELLDLARIESRRGKDFVFERVDVALLIDRILASFHPPGGRAAPLVSASSVAGVVRGDTKKLTQAITNVLSNAYKYSPAGGAVEMEIVERPVATEQDLALPRMLGIRITDRGIGMTNEQLARVCERFYRADTSGKIPGTGLGMSIVSEIVDLHGGALDFASTPGAGTTVTLWLPAIAPESVETTHAAIPESL